MACNFLNSKQMNFITAQIATTYTKEGLEPFVYNEIKQFQEKCLADICHQNGLPSGTKCSKCCTENVVVCPYDRKCNVKQKCKYHNGNARKYRLNSCPKNICHKFEKEIRDAHYYRGPSYANTDATQWCTNPWEVAKCFMPPGGYKDVPSSAKTDFNGIINVLINYKDFDTKDGCRNNRNIFEKARHVGRTMRHFSKAELEDTDLKQYFTDLQNLLSGPKLFASNKDIQTARTKLSQLENDKLLIDWTEYHEMLEKVAFNVRQNINEYKEDMKNESDKQKLELSKAMQKAVEKIKFTGKATLSEINVALQSAVSQIERKTENFIDNIASDTLEVINNVDIRYGKIKADDDASLTKLAVDNDSYVRQAKEKTKNETFKRKIESNFVVEEIKANEKGGMLQIHKDVEKGVENLTTEADIGVKQIKSLYEESIQRIEAKFISSDGQAEDDKYCKIKKDLAIGVRSHIKEDEDDLKEGFKTRTSELMKAKQNAEIEVETTGTSSILEINKASASAVSEIERKTEDFIHKMNSRTEVELKNFDIKLKEIKPDTDASIAKLAVETEIYVRQMNEKSEDIFSKGKTEPNVDAEKIHVQQMEEKFTTKQAKDDEFNQLKKELKEDLADFQRCVNHTIPLSPLFEEKDTFLLDFYIIPRMKVVQRSNFKEEKTAIKSLSEVFKSGSKFNNEIYVTAEAGLGKTAFSKYLTLLWCQAHFQDITLIKYFETESIKAMSEFDFLFLVILRDSSDACSIDDLIFDQIVQNLSRPSLYSRHFLEEILHKERCLIVLDGLDEWTHPDNRCGKVQKRIPHRNARTNCTILTTTRPWVLSITNLRHTDIKIELISLDFESMLTLTTRALLKLKCVKDIGEDESDKVMFEFRNEAEQLISRYHDFEQVHVPLLLMYIINLWCDGFVVQTKCGLYISIIELLLSRTIIKYEKFSQTELPPIVSDIPQCFSEQEHCKAYFPFLTSLGELAFHTLFSETKENRLVFGSSIAEKCLKEENFLELGRLTGIITQDKQSTLTLQIRKTSFSHKTVQEFFAALYISTCADEDNFILNKVLSFCNSIQDILNLSKVFMFISGINAKLFYPLSNEVLKVLNKDEMTSRYRYTTHPDNNNPLREIQEMFVSCIPEKPDDKDVKICLHDFFFDMKCKQENYYKNLQRLAQQNITNLRSIHVCFPGSRSLSDIIDDCDLSNSDCETISCVECKEEDIIRLVSTSLKSLVTLDIQGDNESEDTNSSLTDEQCNTFHNSSQLENIYIWHSVVSHEFLNYTINVKSIQEITLSSLSCRNHGDSCPGFHFDPFQHPELKKLVLVSSNFMLCDMNEDESSLLHEKSKIELVQLTEVKMSSLSFKCLVERIAKLKHSVRVELWCCTITTREEFEYIRDDICRSEKFSVMENGKDGRDRFEFITKT